MFITIFSPKPTKFTVKEQKKVWTYQDKTRGGIISGWEGSIYFTEAEKRVEVWQQLSRIEEGRKDEGREEREGESVLQGNTWKSR